MPYQQPDPEPNRATQLQDARASNGLSSQYATGTGAGEIGEKGRGEVVARTILPWPPSALSPNGSQGNWRGKAKAARCYKADCEALMREKGKAIAALPAGAVVTRVILTYCPPPRVSRFDFDNMGKRMKQGLDALAEALGVDDGAWLSLVQERGKRCRDGAVIVQVEALT